MDQFLSSFLQPFTGGQGPDVSLKKGTFGWRPRQRGRASQSGPVCTDSILSVNKSHGKQSLKWKKQIQHTQIFPSLQQSSVIVTNTKSMKALHRDAIVPIQIFQSGSFLIFPHPWQVLCSHCTSAWMVSCLLVLAQDIPISLIWNILPQLLSSVDPYFLQFSIKTTCQGNWLLWSLNVWPCMHDVTFTPHPPPCTEMIHFICFHH